jgi:hypothetical protein
MEDLNSKLTVMVPYTLKRRVEELEAEIKSTARPKSLDST